MPIKLNLETKIKPMLAFPSKPFSAKDWLFEIKWDGTRAIAFLSKEKVRLQNRRLLDITYRYPELKLNKNLKAREAILDGEIVVLEEGKPDFQKLQEREHIEDGFRIELLAKEIPATYICFDLLYLDGETMLEKPLLERKETLAKILDEDETLLISTHILERGKEFFEKAVRLGFEGIMAKKISSPYLIGKRSRLWLKIKKSKTLDCVILGFTKGEGERSELFGSLILGCYKYGKLIHLGQVGTGFTLEEMKRLKALLDKIRTEKCPFEEKIDIEREAFWVKPKYVCEVEFLEFTKDLKLRAPRFKRLRLDKTPEDCKVNF